MMRNAMSSAGSTLQLPGKPGEAPGSAASAVPATGGGSGGGGGGVGGGEHDQPSSQGALSAAGAARASVAAATTPPPGVVASDEAIATYGKLPDLPQIIGTAAVTGKRALGAEATSLSSPLPRVTPREFVVTPAMAESTGKKFSDGNLSITREHMSGIMALLKYLYDIRLPRFGTTTPYEPLFPVVARGVVVDFEAVDATHQGKIQLDLKNVSSQKKYTTFVLLLFMIYDQNDSAYEWIVGRFCGGMRASTKSNTAGKARRSNKSKTKKAGAIAAAAAAPANHVATAGVAAAAAAAASPAGVAAAAASTSGDVAPGARGPRDAVVTVHNGLPPVGKDLYVGKQRVGSAEVHLEFYEHHGHRLPKGHVSAFAQAAEPGASDVLYEYGTDSAFCLDAPTRAPRPSRSAFGNAWCGASTRSGTSYSL